MTFIYYDTFTGWDKFQKFLDDPLFLKHFELYKWWLSSNFDINKTPLMEIFHNYLLSHGALDDNEKKENMIVIKNAKKCDKSHPYWWCSLHDCVGSNSILMASLLSLADKKEFDDIYILNIKFPDGTLADHQVVSDKYIEPNTIINIEHGINTTNKYVIYDLIHPIHNKINNSLNFNNITNCTVTYCETITNNWKGMNYIQYFKNI